MATLHRLAAAVLDATDARERWNVVVDGYGDTSGRVYLELSTGSCAETDRAMALMRSVARRGVS